MSAASGEIKTKAPFLPNFRLNFAVKMVYNMHLLNIWRVKGNVSVVFAQVNYG
jgi:hypothetical protein